MDRFRTQVWALVKPLFDKISMPETGVVTGYDHETKMAQVTTINKSGRGNRIIEAPWPASPDGIISGAPSIGITHVTVSYRGGNYCEPIISNAHEPNHYVGRRERECRTVENYTTKTDANLI